HQDFAVARLHRDGGLDTGFGEGGEQLIDFGSNHEAGGWLEVQPDGKIIVAGASWQPQFDPNEVQDFAVARLTTDGDLDPPVATRGRLLLDVPSAAFV